MPHGRCSCRWFTRCVGLLFGAGSVLFCVTRWQTVPRPRLKQAGLSTFCQGVFQSNVTQDILGRHGAEASPMAFKAFLRRAKVTDQACKETFSKTTAFNALELSYTKSTLCVQGFGYETRAESQAEMLRDAVTLLNNCSIKLGEFSRKIMSLNDAADCAPWGFTSSTSCQLPTRLIPDFSFYAWPEAGLLPNYSALTQQLRLVSLLPPEKQLCGWAGSLITNPVRGKLFELADRKLIEVVTPKATTGTGGGRVSMPEQDGACSVVVVHPFRSALSRSQQVKRWACLVDAPAAGYSGRVPLLLSSGRVLLLIGRGPNQTTDRTFYAHLLQAWVHYIPVAHDLSDLNSKADFVLGKGQQQAQDIARNAQDFAAKHLTYQAAVQRLARELALESWNSTG
eukprot:Skav223601  [mRNA]  locus=scaffold493:393360:395780:+ [translate_table: standard]